MQHTIKKHWRWLFFFDLFVGPELFFDFFGGRTRIEALWPFLKPFLQTFGICLIIIAVVYALLFWYDRRNKEARKDSPHWRFTRVSVLANRIERREATVEEEEEYYERITSFWGQGFFSGCDPENYKEVSERAQCWAKKFF